MKSIDFKPIKVDLLITCISFARIDIEPSQCIHQNQAHSLVPEKGQTCTRKINATITQIQAILSRFQTFDTLSPIAPYRSLPFLLDHCFTIVPTIFSGILYYF